MAILSRDAIRKKTQGYKTQVVPIPSWGGEVIVRELTGEEVTQVGLAAVDEEGNPQADGVTLSNILAAMPQIVAWTVVDEGLQPILTVEDVRAMTSEHLDVIQELAEIALELSDLTEATGEEDGQEDGEPDPN